MQGGGGLKSLGQYLGACRTCGFFALDAAKNPDYLASFGSLQGKNSPNGEFYYLMG
jgi:hypothetical protein